MMAAFLKKLSFSFSIIILISVLFSSSLWAKSLRRPNSVLISSCSHVRGLDTCSYQIFKEITQLYRPSKDEKALRQYIEDMVSRANIELWQARPLTIESDAKGNILVRVPGTGEFATSEKSIALQAHMDMTLKHIDQPDKEKVKDLFRNGIETEEVERLNPTSGQKEIWLQSKGNRSTLGADNGAGVAQMLFYVLNPTLVHPPLELIFTVEEEVGLLGARDLGLAIKSKVLLSTDSNIAGMNKSLLRSSMGGISKRISGRIDTQRIDGDLVPHKFIRIQISNLLGGHSGNDIHLERINSIFLFSELIRKFATEHKSLTLVSVKIPGGLNTSIPNALDATLAVTEAHPQLAEEMQNWLTKKVESSSAEKANSKRQIKVDFQLAKGSFEIISNEKIVSLANTILRMPNGLVINDPSFTDGVRSSSNLGDLIFPLQDPKLKDQNIQIGFMSRASSSLEYTDTNQKIDSAFSDFIKNKHTNVIGEFPAVTLNIDNWLIQQALKSCPEILTRVETGKATSELSYFTQKFPELDFLILGVPLEGGDTVQEKLSIEGMRTFQTKLTTLLKDIGLNSNFK